MSVANWTTRFLVGSAQGGEMQPDGQGSPPAGDESHGESAQHARPQSIIGTRVGAYLITKRLGAGGVGEVFKAVDVMLKRDVAIKVLRQELASDPLFLERFRREAQLHGQLSHPNVASVHTFLHEGDTQFMVMEYVAGISLDEFIRSGGPVPVERALGIFRRALDGIEHAHGCGIVHRDIKPANIMLADSGQVKVMDFGIARALDSQDHLTRHGHVAGTAKSLSPEQIRGGQADVRSDIYSLGIVLYTLLAGRAPFDGDNDFELMKSQLEQAPPPLRGLVDSLPPKVEAAVMRALEKDPSARFQSVGEFSAALDECVPRRGSAASLPTVAVAVSDAQTSSRTALNPALTESRTVMNPALLDAPHLPSGSTGRPAQDAGSLRPSAAALLRLPKRGRRVAAVALAILALGAGTALMWPHLAAHTTVAVAPPRPAVIAPSEQQQPSAPLEAAAAEQIPALSDQAPAPAAVTQPTSPQALGTSDKPRTLAILRLPSGGAAAAAAGSDSSAAAPDAVYRFKPGEQIRLLIKPSHDAHVYCYLQDEARRIVRFYPNRFSKSALVKADTPLEIPGQMRFELVANTLKVPETVACFASERDLLGELPAAVVGTDFAKLKANSLDKVKNAFARAAAEPLAEASFRVAFK